MAIPVIITAQSVLGYRQWQEWAYQPFATNTPTYWTCSPLPPGITMDAVTGIISGIVETPGVYNFELRAGNADGLSTGVIFTMGIEATAWGRPSSAIDLEIDLITRNVKVSGVTSAATVANTATSTTEDKPIMWLKSGDDYVFNIKFTKNNAVADLALTELSVAVKDYEPESVLASGSSWRKIGVGPNAYYQVAISLDGDDLTQALGNYETDFKTAFNALMEFQWKETNGFTIGDSTLYGSTRNFRVDLSRDLIANS